MTRRQQIPNRRFRLGDWEVYPTLDRLVRGDEEVHVEPRVMDVLSYLAEHPGEVLPRSVILDAVWLERYVSDAVLTRAIAVLRRLLGDDACHPRYIETIPKRGYRLIAHVDSSRRRRSSDPIDARPGSTPSRFALVINDRLVSLPLGDSVIGRAPDADVRVYESAVSRRHARISVRGGDITVEDLQSKNGTWYEGRRLTCPRHLADGDRLVLGDVSVVIRDVSLTSTATDPGSDARAAGRDPEVTRPEAREPLHR